MKLRNIAIAAAATLLTVSCGDMLDTDSSIVEFEKNNRITDVADTVYNMLGIINTMQVVAERNALVGEVHSDLVSITDKASADLKALADFTATTDNSYNRVSDYYNVINTCNNFIAKADTTLMLKGVKVFKREYVAAKVFRAWAYLQAVQLYGKLPLVTTPVYGESQAQKEMQKAPSDIKTICSYLAEDLKPYVNERVPNYGSSIIPQSSFIPVRVMLGDLYLWADDYENAAKSYYDYLTLQEKPQPTDFMYQRWGTGSKEFTAENHPSISSMAMGTSWYGHSEAIANIALESQPYYGHQSQLYYLYNSDVNHNNSYVSLTPSGQMREIFKRQHYTHLYIDNNNHRDTLDGPQVDQFNDNLKYLQGDLRYRSFFTEKKVNRDEYSPYSPWVQIIGKFSTSGFNIYRKSMVYLRLAEALNRLNYPQTAMCILKYGLCKNYIYEHIDSVERQEAARFLNWDEVKFTTTNTMGIHGHGSGYVECDTIHYVLPQTATALASRQDTVAYQVPLVEDMIIEEMALEGALEGNRFYDLMRVALRRDDPDYLAERVALRDGTGTPDAALLALLRNKANWYLPLRK